MEWHCILDLLHDSWNCMAESYVNLMQVYQQFVAVDGHTIFLVLSENHYNAAQYIGVLFKPQLRWQTWCVGQNFELTQTTQRKKMTQSRLLCRANSNMVLTIKNKNSLSSTSKIFFGCVLPMLLQNKDANSIIFPPVQFITNWYVFVATWYILVDVVRRPHRVNVLLQPLLIEWIGLCGNTTISSLNTMF